MWKSIKSGNRNAAFGFDLAWALLVGMRGEYHSDYTEVAWKDFGQKILEVSQKYGDHSPEDTICSWLVHGVRCAIDSSNRPAQ